ncbi:hypothetical protein MMA231_03457 (plasmid) [Asticcacaulis sp. MM231]|uniref:hypothetical protein n=1 Tax=Asticcacaulis sp. MM231 TaxID=3157666 RepID=UPI0032D56B9F
MAKIIKHPDVQDYFLEFTLDEIKARPHGIIEEYEANNLILLKNYRMPIDLAVFSEMSSHMHKIEDESLRRKLKKMTSLSFFQGYSKTELGNDASGLDFNDKVSKAVFEVLCNSDKSLFMRASQAMEDAHKVTLDLFATCFPDYYYYRMIPSIRITETLFENIHWDNHQIEDDFQQVRIFCNLDNRPRIWNASHNFVNYARTLYKDHNLSQFAGGDPNLLNDYICGKVLGGTRNACKDHLPKHTIAFEPGEIWFGELRMISHQIMYGERAMVYMFFIKPEGMLNGERRFNRQVENLHREMAGELV